MTTDALTGSFDDADRQGAESVVDRVRAIIETLSAEGSLGVTALARRTGLPKSTVHRLCSQLCDWGVVGRAEGRFEIGPRLAELTGHQRRKDPLAEVGRPYLVEFVSTVRIGAGLAVMVGGNVRCVDKTYIAGREPARWVDVGTTAPAHLTAAGKAILAFSSAAGDRTAAASGGDPLSTGAEDGALIRELSLVRREGLSRTRHLRGGGTSIAAPILGSTGVVHGALGCSVAERGEPAVFLGKVEAALRTQAARIARAMDRQLAAGSAHRDAC